MYWITCLANRHDMVQRERYGWSLLCILVLTMSNGWTVSVAIEPANRPAMVSTRAGERPACLTSVIERKSILPYMPRKKESHRRE